MALDLAVANDVREIERVVMDVIETCRPLVTSPRILTLNIPVALTEALANAMLRGNHNDPVQHVGLVMSVTDEHLIFDVIDQGPGFDLEQNLREPSSANNRFREDGRGLFLMRELMDHLEQFRDARGNVVRLTIRRDHAAQQEGGSSSHDAISHPAACRGARSLELEIENATRELAERYEEINLLYSISEILGRTSAWDEAAKTILREVSDTVGARRAVIYVSNSSRTMLRCSAVIGVRADDIQPVSIDDDSSVPARVFQTQVPMVLNPDDPDDGDSFRVGAMLSVPITGVTQHGKSELLGVMTFTDRWPGQAFSAGDVKLMTAIATQIGNALQNARLVRAAIEQERLSYEMQLAHDLQMKLLPSVSVVAPQARVAARVIPAQSVGGDFYHLLKITPSATGVLMGDVSGHGFQSALIMALALSAASIHAQATTAPDMMLQAFFRSLQEELEHTEMFISVFYGVVDADAGTLHYANAGLPHAFQFRDGTPAERLSALDPPLGMFDGIPGVRSIPWRHHQDTLLLFTDGIPDARNAAGDRLGESEIIDIVQKHLGQDPELIVQSVLQRVKSHTGRAAQGDDMTVLILRG